MTDQEKLEQRIAELISMTDKFCNEYINAEYAALCKKMIEKLGRKRSVRPLATGRLNIWAATVVYTIATNNFLFDKTFEPYIPLAQIHDYFDTKSSTVSAKAAKIRQLLKMRLYFDTEFSTMQSLENNPFLNVCRIGDLFFLK